MHASQPKRRAGRMRTTACPPLGGFETIRGVERNLSSGAGGFPSGHYAERFRLSPSAEDCSFWRSSSRIDSSNSVAS